MKLKLLVILVLFKSITAVVIQFAESSTFTRTMTPTISDTSPITTFKSCTRSISLSKTISTSHSSSITPSVTPNINFLTVHGCEDMGYVCWDILISFIIVASIIFIILCLSLTFSSCYYDYRRKKRQNACHSGENIVMYHEPSEELVNDDRFSTTKSANYGTSKKSYDEEYKWEIK